jgi:flagellin-like protein
MKKIWKIRKNREAVSPVIATILMVAITVVLAAVLYVMVMGFGTTGNQTPQGSFTGVPQSVSVTPGPVAGYKLQFGVITPATKFIDCKVVVTVGTAASAAQTIVLAGNNIASTPVTSIRWVDLASDGTISQGDYLTISGGTVAAPVALAAGTYTVTILFTSTGGSICSQSWTF